MMNKGFHLYSSATTRLGIESTLTAYSGFLARYTDIGKEKVNKALSEYDELIYKHYPDDVEISLTMMFENKPV